MGIYQGTSGNDSITGSKDNDTLYGLDGNDTLIGGAGADLIDGGAGDDVFQANDDSGADTLIGGDGNDVFNLFYNYGYVGVTAVKIDAGAGDDLIHLSFAQWAYLTPPEVTGGAGTDTYQFGASASYAPLVVTDFTAGVGGDKIDLRDAYVSTYYNNYYGGNPFASGKLQLVQVGNDTEVRMISMYQSTVQTALILKNVAASSLTIDNFVGGWNPDGTGIPGQAIDASASEGGTFYGGLFNDTITGGVGNSVIDGQGGDDLILGGSGNEDISDGYGNDTIDAGAGNDTLRSIDGNDVLLGGDGNDYFAIRQYASDNHATVVAQGGAGNDTISGLLSDSTGVMQVSGGDGRDTYRIQAHSGVMDIQDFQTGANGDILDVYDLLDNLLRYEGGNPMNASLGHMRMLQQGPDLLLQVDYDGNGSEQAMQTVAILRNVSVASLTLNNVSGANPNGPVAPGLLLQGTAGSEDLNGSYLNDTIDGGSAGPDVLRGRGGDDLLRAALDSQGSTLDGGSGNDTLHGGTGNDTLSGGDGNDKLYGGDGDDYLDVGAGNDYAEGGEGSDQFQFSNGAGNATLLGGAGDDNLYINLGFAGGASVRFEGGAGNDSVTLYGGNLSWPIGGKLTVTGGAGVDTYIFSGAAASSNYHITDFTGGAGGDLLDLAYMLPNDVSPQIKLDPIQAGYVRLVQQGTAVLLQYDQDGTGSAYAAQTIATLDNLKVGDLTSANFKGQLVEAVYYYANQLYGTLGNDTLQGHSYNDRLESGRGDDLLDGGQGADTMIGGTGNDTYLVDNAGDVVSELLGGGSDTVKTTLNAYTLGANVEALEYTGKGNFQGSGNSAANLLTGGSGDDTLDGVGGGDVLNGRDGNDWYVLRSVDDRVLETAGNGFDTVQVNYATTAYILGANLESAVAGPGTLAINLTGNDGDNVLTGNDGVNLLTGGLGNDTLDGGGGADKLAGGKGDDLLLVDNAGDVVTELANEGKDTVSTTLAQYKLSANVENLLYAGDGNFNGTGNELDNDIRGGAGNDVLTGGAGNDTLYGMGGADTIDGGDGNDIVQLNGYFEHYTISRSGGVVLLVNTLTGERISLKGVELLNFVDGSRPLTELLVNQVSDGDDFLTGTTGADTLDGLSGADTMAGDDGDDLYVIDNVNDVIRENAGQGNDTAEVNISTTGSTYVLGANVENALIGATNKAAINLTGNDLDNILSGSAAANTLTGGAGDDTLDGAAGADKLLGGSGNDTYYVDNSGDLITEALSEGSDSVRTTLASYTLGANLENLTAAGSSAFTGTGNALNNIIEGAAGNDTLSGLAGNDTLRGGAGNDVLQGGDGDDLLDGGTGSNIIDGGNGSDTAIALADFSAYTITRPNASDTVLVNTVSGESLTLRNIEFVSFNGEVKAISEVQRNIRSVGNDFLTGTSGNDTLDGGLGADNLSGGDGDDTYIVDVAGDRVVEAANGGIDQVNVAFTAAATYVLDENVENATVTTAVAASITGNALDNLLIGNAAINTLTGGAGNDTLDGGAGADKLLGGLGDDVYQVDNAGDVVTELAGQGTDRVETSLARYTLSVNVDNLLFTGSAAFGGTGNELANAIRGGNGNDTLLGLAGSDTLNGGLGNDSLDGGAGADQLDGGDGNDTLLGGADNDALNAGKAGTPAANGIADLVDGGAGDDTLTVAGNFTDYARSRPNATDTVLINTLTGEHLTLRNVEFVVFSDGQKTIADVQVNLKSAGNDFLTGTSGNDTLDGGLGADKLSGGDGDDTYIVDVAGDRVVEALNGGVDLVKVAFTAAGTYVLDENVENATITSTAAASITGNALDNILSGNAAANTLTGGAGNDTLDGGAGADKLVGGSGDDVYKVDNAGDLVSELANDGNDRVETGLARYTLSANVEQLLFTGTAAFAGSGNALDNLISGGNGNDTLVGLAGNDTLNGGLGNDSLDGGIGDDTLNGGDGNDVLTGGAGADQLNGGDGNDTLLGGADNDVFNAGSAGKPAASGIADLVDGGTGDDTLIVAGKFADYARSRPNATDTVLINTATGEHITLRNIDQVVFSDGVRLITDVQLNLKSLGNDSLTGSDAADTLDGGAGADTLVGGLGDDTYIVDVAGDRVVEAADGGVDLVKVAFSAAGTYVLDENVEHATITSVAAVNLTGNGLDNLLTGNAAVNTLTGGAGNDTLDGGAGADKLIGGLGDDSYLVDNAGDTITELVGGGHDTVTVKATASYTLAAQVEDLLFIGTTAFTGTGNVLDNSLIGGSGNDNLSGLAGDDTLIGNAGNDKLLGGDGSDVLIGGDGNDTITGGSGADIIVLDAKTGSDTVTDFVSGSDKLSISQSVFGIGNGDLVIDNAMLKTGPGGYANDAELVILTQNVATLNATTAAAAIGSASTSYAAGDKALFALHSGSTTTLYLFTSAGADALVSASELTQLVTLTGTPATALADYQFA